MCECVCVWVCECVCECEVFCVVFAPHLGRTVVMSQVVAANIL